MKLLFKLIRMDYRRNKVITTALAVFLILSTLLMAGGLRVAGTMISSLKGLNEVALPPAYLQLHKGEYDEAAFENFVRNHDYIKDSQVIKMLDINNANIYYHGETLEKCLMDNGFVIQSEGFDYLLNMNNELPTIKEGEIGVPVYYTEELGIKVGDILTLRNGNYNKDLIVSIIIRDSTMNAALTSSKRFLITKADQDEISSNMGYWEYSFEFLLSDGVSPSVLAKDYMDAGMPANGVAITGSLVSMLNGFSYGLNAFIIVAISILLIIVASLCLSYIIRATLAEENTSIGEMKAIGFPRKAIIKLYQLKYIFLVLIAIVIGYLLAIPFGNFFSVSVIKYCGNGTNEWMKWIFPVIGLFLLGMYVILKCRRIIKKNLKSTVVELMRGEERIKKEGRYSLPHKGLKLRNLTITLGELKCKWKEYLVIFFVFVFSSFLILLPMNMKNTVQNPSFMTYMGVGKSDIRIDLQYNDNIVEQKDELISFLDNDSEIKRYTVFRYGLVQFQNSESQWENIRVENGNESIFPLEYLKGWSPNNSDEMALSYLNAIELDKKVGDSLTVVYQGNEMTFKVCGIYQDITYGGKTAKAAINFSDSDVEVFIVYLDVKDDVSIDNKTNQLRSLLKEGKITPTSEFVSQTLGGITDNMNLIEGAAIIISLVLISLITVMILKLITAKEHSDIAIKKAIGFSNKDIRLQLGLRILIIQFVAIIVGTVLANTLGEAIFGLMLSSMGAAKIILLVEPVSSYILSPIIQILVAVIMIFLGTKVVGNYHIKDQIIE